jgi:DNA-binding XRE family transcriptional regulator
MPRNESCCDTRCYQPSCHTCFYLTIIFRTVATNTLFQHWKWKNFPHIITINVTLVTQLSVMHCFWQTHIQSIYLPEHCMGTNGTTPHSSVTFPNTTVPSTTFLSTPASSTHISVVKKLSVSTVTINSCDNNYKTEWWSLCRSLDCRHFRAQKVLSQVPECCTHIQTHDNPTV